MDIAPEKIIVIDPDPATSAEIQDSTRFISTVQRS